RSLESIPVRGRPRALLQTLAAALERKGHKLARACYERLQPVLPPIPALADNAEFARYINTLERVQRAYLPHVYPGRAILFQASDRTSEPGAEHVRLGWEGLAADGLERHEVPGDHLSIFSSSHLRTLAEKLRDCLCRSRSLAPGSIVCLLGSGSLMCLC